jgi:hypothetical protein
MTSERILIIKKICKPAHGARPILKIENWEEFSPEEIGEAAAQLNKLALVGFFDRSILLNELNGNSGILPKTIKVS